MIQDTLGGLAAAGGIFLPIFRLDGTNYIILREPRRLWWIVFHLGCRGFFAFRPWDIGPEVFFCLWVTNFYLN